MLVQDAQREVREVYLRGAVGQAVSGIIWLVSAVLALLSSPILGMWALILGGVLIFPLTSLVIKITGRRASLPKSNPLNALAMQVAFVLPLCIPVILGAVSADQNWFYPAFMIVLGAHYLPFIFLYGMWDFGVLAAVLIFAGVGFRMFAPDSFALGGFFTAVVLLIFAIVQALRLTIPGREQQKEQLE